MSHTKLPMRLVLPSKQLVNLGSNEEAPPSYRASIQEGKPLDISQRLERKLAKYNASHNVWKRWFFEIVSWTASAACMVSRTPSILLTDLDADIDTTGCCDWHLTLFTRPAPQRSIFRSRLVQRTFQNRFCSPDTAHF